MAWRAKRPFRSPGNQHPDERGTKAAPPSLRDALLNEELFDSFADARRKLAMWRYDYNNVRPHSSLGNRTPAQVRRTFLQDGSVTPGALVPAGEHEYQTGGLSI